MLNFNVKNLFAQIAKRSSSLGSVKFQYPRNFNSVAKLLKALNLSDKKNFFLFSLTIILNLGAWLAIAKYFPKSEELIPLHYSIYFGIDFIGRKSWLFNFPAIGLCFFVINLFISVLLYRNEKLASYALLASSLIMQLLLGLIIYLVISI